MRDGAFHRWLAQRYPVAVAATRLSNVRRVELALGDLDFAYDRDRLKAAMARLAYNRSEQRAGVTNRSGIAIDGDVYNGLATLRTATKLYGTFRSEPVADREFVHP